MRIAGPVLPFAALVALPLVSACADRPPRVAQAVVPTGDPVGCVLLNQIRQTRVIDDQTIDFEMVNRQLYRNTLPNRCPNLGFERAFSYRTSINQLCNVDIITVIPQGGAVPIGASCGLGMFVPVKPVPKDEAKG